jgi:hypothetical protein
MHHNIANYAICMTSYEEYYWGGSEMTEITISKNMIIKNTNNSYCLKISPN